MKRYTKIPFLPLSALVFYLGAFILWTLGFIPTPSELIVTLEGFYVRYGLIGMFIASLLEGLVYVGLYLAGSSIIILGVLLSDGRIPTLILMTLIVAIGFTIISIVNYFLGRKAFFARKRMGKIKKRYKKRNFLLSFLHPNSLAFYFFNHGMRKGDFERIALVPLIVVPYGLIIAFLISQFRPFFKAALEAPYVIIIAILIWFFIALYVENRNG